MRKLLGVDTGELASQACAATVAGKSRVRACLAWQTHEWAVVAGLGQEHTRQRWVRRCARQVRRRRRLGSATAAMPMSLSAVVWMACHLQTGAGGSLLRVDGLA